MTAMSDAPEELLREALRRALREKSVAAVEHETDVTAATIRRFLDGARMRSSTLARLWVWARQRASDEELRQYARPRPLLLVPVQIGPRPRRPRASAPAETPPARVNLTGIQLQSTEPAPPSHENALAPSAAE
jgi:hypothetical protein